MYVYIYNMLMVHSAQKKRKTTMTTSIVYIPIVGLL